jgi:hypothetical protein
MMKSHLNRFLLLSSIAAMASAAYAQKKGVDYEYDNEKPWVEIQAQLPPYPQTENLLKFDAGPASDNSHYVDAPSISVGEDAVVRYTLVIKSPSGATNISYEGIRCQTAEKRIYAYGRNNNTWAPARISKWTDLESIAQNYPQRALYRYFFCPLGVDMIADADEAVRALKAGVHPRAVKY